MSEFIKSQENSTAKIDEFKKSLTPALEYESQYPQSLGIDPKVVPAKRVAFLVDYSGSMKRVSEGSTLISQALDNVVNLLQDFVSDNDCVSFSLFDHQYFEVFPMMKKMPSMFDAIANAPSPKRGGTAFFDSLITIISSIPEGGDNDWIIALTDGEDQHSENTLSDCLNSIRRSNINVFLIGFMVSERVAKGLSTIVKEVCKGKIGRYITASDKRALEMAFADVASLMEVPIMMT